MAAKKLCLFAKFDAQIINYCLRASSLFGGSKTIIFKFNSEFQQNERIFIKLKALSSQLAKHHGPCAKKSRGLALKKPGLALKKAGAFNIRGLAAKKSWGTACIEEIKA